MNFIEQEYYDILPNQKSFYFSRSIVDNSLYNQGVVFYFDMKLNEEELNNIYNTILRTNDSLRIKFTDNSKFCISKFVKETVDVPYFESTVELFTYADAEVNTPLDVTVKCFKAIPFITPDNTGFILIAHHLICDGMSSALIINRFIEAANKNSDNLTYSYKNHILDEEKYLVSEKAEKDRKYLENQLQKYGDSRLFQGLTDNDYSSSLLLTEYKPEYTYSFFNYCKQNNIYPAAALSGLTALSLYRVFGNEKLCIGTPVSNRFSEYDMKTFGLFMHIIPLFISFETSSFSEYIEKVNDEYLTLLRHNMLNDVYDDGQSANPLFDIAVNCSPENENTRSYPIFSDSLSLAVEIHFSLRKDNGINFTLRYRKSIINSATADAIAEIIRVLLSSFGSNIDNSIQTIDIISHKDREKLISGFNNTYRETDYSKKLYTYFSDKAKTNPDQIAIIQGKSSTSYSQLNSLITDYASKLSCLGYGVNDKIAVNIDRTADLIALQMAVIYIGAVFVPVSRSNPENRICKILSDCNAGCYIYDNDFSCATDTKCLKLNEFLATDISSVPDPLFNESCYIIYTSGSTGAPKGCLLSEKGLINFCVNNNTLSSVKKTNHPVFACLNNAAFDYFIAETILPLVNGFTVVLFSEYESLNQKVFLQAVKENKINILMTTPTRLNLFYSDAEDLSPLLNMKCICSSGEKLPANLLNTMRQKSPEADIFNPLGPSECSVWVAGGEIPDDEISIGYPISNVQLYVLDYNQQIVPFNVVGELCITGIAVGNGYINNSELTSKSFVRNPFGEGLMYRTGDLVYRKNNGSLIYVGRNDFQVKHHGIRIELSEIENAVSVIEGIDCAVALMKKQNNRQHLVVYYTGSEKSENEIKKILVNSLPSYMIPERFINTNKIYLTQNGKTDTNKLPEIDFSAASDTYMEPENESEAYVCDLFSSILNTDHVGKNDSFFDLGGDSISSIKLLSDEKFKMINYSDLILHPTPSELSVFISESKSSVISETVHLQLLHLSPEANSVLVLFPYAGGNSVGFIDLIELMKEENCDIYFCPFFKNSTELHSCIEDIQKIRTGKSLLFYSHCAGSSLALTILSYMKNKSLVMPDFYLASASIPKQSSKSFNPRRLMPKPMITVLLNKAGLGVDKGYIDTDKFLNDTDVYFDLLSREFNVVDCNTYVLLSKNDIFTRNWSSAEELWCKFLNKRPVVEIKDYDTHYYQKSEAKYISEILKKYKDYI